VATDKKLCLSGRGVTKVFGIGRQKLTAVDHVDFDFHEGEIISIVGESGSGKTTLAKMLLGLISSSEGDIYFQGQKRDIRSGRKRQEYWKNIQAIFQYPFLPTTPFTRSTRFCWTASACVGEASAAGAQGRTDGGSLRFCQLEIR
jgi:peptide/nickel transport system ATP-binding protein